MKIPDQGKAMHKKFDLLIKKQAWNCYKKLPACYLSIEDLIQEGHLVLIKMMRKRYKPEMGKFSTLLTKALMNSYGKIVRTAYTKKRASLTVIDPYQDEYYVKDQFTQQDAMERKELLKRIREVDEDIADMLEVGVSPELLIYARNRARNRAVKSGRKLNKISFSIKIIEKFYGISFKTTLNRIHSNNI